MNKNFTMIQLYRNTIGNIIRTLKQQHKEMNCNILQLKNTLV